MSRFNNPAILLQPGKRPQPREAIPAVSAVRLSRITPPAATTSAWAPAVDNPGVLERLGFMATLAYVFIRFALLSDIGNHVLGFNPKFAYLTAPLGLIAVLTTGGFARSVQSRIGKFFCLYMVWLVIATPFSVWRGGSVDLLITAFEANFSMFFLIVVLTKTWAQCRQLLYAMAAGGAVDVLASRFYGQSVDGRFAFTFGTLQNPNDLATHLLLILPLSAFVILVSSRFSVGKLVFLLTAIGVLFTVLRTGSRAGFLALLAMSIFAVFRASIVAKMALITLALVAIPLTLTLLPPELRLRYLSIFDSEAGSNQSDDTAARQAEYARGSEQGRIQLLTNSLTTTIYNPIFGVGPGQFAVADADDAKLAGRRAGWQVTHNAYTQVSAEAGILAFVFFIGSFVGALRLLWLTHVRTRPYPQLKQLTIGSYCLLLSGVGLSINLFFSALAYGYYLPTLIGLAMVMSSIASAEVERLRAVKSSLSASSA